MIKKESYVIVLASFGFKHAKHTLQIQRLHVSWSSHALPQIEGRHNWDQSIEGSLNDRKGACGMRACANERVRPRTVL